MYLEKEKNISNEYLVASILMLVFVLNDLVFDFLFTFDGSNYISFTFTVLASIITFFGSYGVIKFGIKNRADRISYFVTSNFNAPQVIFSVLDIFCSVISLLSGVILLGSIFKIVKIVYIPIKFMVVANKGKTIFKAIERFSLIWIIGRLLSKNFKGGELMKTWIKNNKMTLVYSFVLSPLSGFVSFKLLPMYLIIPLWATIVLSVVVGILAIVAVVLLGGDKVKQAVYRGLSMSLDSENYEKVTNYANQLLTQQKFKEEIHKLAMEEYKAQEKEKEKNFLLNAGIVLSEEEKQALVNAELEKIKNSNNK